MTTERGRLGVYCLVAGAFYLLALLAVMLKGDFDFAVSDGRYYYAYLPSLVVDRDLDFENQIREHWGPDFSEALLADCTAAGLVHNKYPIGLALSLAPAFAVAHVLSLGLFAVSGLEQLRPDGYSVLYQLFDLAFVMALGVATLVLVDRLLVRRLRIEPLHACLAVLLYWTGTHWVYYFFREPLMVHVTSAFWVAACAHLCLEAGELGFTRPGSLRRAAALAATAGMAIVTRPTNAAILLPFLAPLLVRPGFVRAAPVIVGVGALPLLAQLLVWRELHGSWLHYSYHDEGFHWLRPALLSTLVSSRHGLFFWAPLLVFALAGIVLAIRSGLSSAVWRVLAPWLVAALLLWYVNACWHQWWFGDAFGGRAFLELTPLFVIGLALFLRTSSAWRSRTRAAAFAGMALSFAWTWALMALYVTHRIPRGDYLF